MKKPTIPSKTFRTIGLVGIALLILKIFLSYYQLRFEESVSKIMIPCLICFVWYATPYTKWPTWFTGCSFPIFLAHMITFPFIGIALKHLCPIDDQSKAFLYCSIGIIAPMILVAILKKFLPRVNNFFFAGRS